jgi:methylaspartate mutase epsilon subunit
LVPPFVAITVAVLEGILALRQGVKSITLGYGQGGNLIQDLAAMIALKEIAHDYFGKENFSDYELTSVFHQWMGGFPEEEAKAFSVICWGATVASLAKAEKVIVKSPHEAMGIPTKEANAQGLKATRQIVNMLADQQFPRGPELEREVNIIKSEVKCLLDKVYELGAGDIEAGIVPGFESGALDIPFAPAMCNHGKILPMRDDEGFIRVFNKGNLPLSKEIMDFHTERLEARAKAEDRSVCFQMVTDDIYAISKGKLVGRPK